jgi:hypothetical protein
MAMLVKYGNQISIIEVHTVLMRYVPKRGYNPLIALYVSYLVTFIFFGQHLFIFSAIIWEPLEKKSNQDLGSQSAPAQNYYALYFLMIYLELLAFSNLQIYHSADVSDLQGCYDEVNSK